MYAAKQRKGIDMNDNTPKTEAEKTAALHEIAEDVERERRERGRTEFDDQGVAHGEPPVADSSQREDVPVDDDIAQALRAVPPVHPVAPGDETPSHNQMK